jgi:hypothetical protein
MQCSIDSFSLKWLIFVEKLREKFCFCSHKNWSNYLWENVWKCSVKTILKLIRIWSNLKKDDGRNFSRPHREVSNDELPIPIASRFQSLIILFPIFCVWRTLLKIITKTTTYGRNCILFILRKQHVVEFLLPFVFEKT